MPGSTITAAQQDSPSPGGIRRTAGRLVLLTAALAVAGTALSAPARAASTTTVAVGQQPAALAKTDPRSRTPWNAQLLALAVAAVAPIGLGIWQGSYLAAFGWAGQVIVFFILIPTSPSTWPTPSTTCAIGASGSTGWPTRWPRRSALPSTATYCT